MGVDRISAGSDDDAETVEQRPADRRPPPPPDRPGSDGFPSRAESRARAAAANNTEVPAEPSVDERKSAATDATAESSNVEESEVAEQKEPSVGSQLDDGSSEPPAKDAESGRPGLSADPEQATERPAGSPETPGPSATDAMGSRQGEASVSAPEAPEVSGSTAMADDDHFTEDSDIAANRVAPVAEQAGRKRGGAVPTSKSDIKSNDGSDSANRRTFEILVGETPVRLHIDPVAARIPLEARKEEYEPGIRSNDAPWEDGVDRLSDLPPGEELAKMESDKASRFERARKKGYEVSGDVINVTDKGADSLQGLLSRKPPTGQAETRSGQPIIEAQHHGIDPGDAATALLMLGIVMGEGVRSVVEHSRERRREN